MVPHKYVHLAVNYPRRHVCILKKNSNLCTWGFTCCYCLPYDKVEKKNLGSVGSNFGGKKFCRGAIFASHECRFTSEEGKGSSLSRGRHAP